MNKIGWCTHTVNVVVGCRNGCPYCYARKMAPRAAAMRAAATGEPVCEKCRDFEPHFHEERLPQLGKGKNRRVFIDSMSDLWGDGVQPEWRDAIFEQVWSNPQNQYIALTKCPHAHGPIPLPWPQNLWYGVSVTGHPGAHEQEDEAIHRLECAHAIGRSVVSVEPLLGPVAGDLRSENVFYYHVIPSWLIVGPQTGSGARRTPLQEWDLRKVLDDVIAFADEYRIPLYLKDGCYKMWPDLPLRQELPSEMEARSGNKS